MPCILLKINLFSYKLININFYWNVSDVTLDPLLSLRKDLKGMTDINFSLAHFRCYALGPGTSVIQYNLDLVLNCRAV